MKTILVPTDFSHGANNALNYALEIARHAAGPSKVILLHVVFPSEGVNNNIYDAFWIEDYFKAKTKLLEKLANRFKRNADFALLDIQPRLEVGFPVGVIADVAKREKADLIVMGTTGASGLREILLGSVTGAVIGRTKAPVLVVPKKGVFRRKTPAAFATDFHINLDHHSHSVLKEMLRLHHADLKVVNVLEKSGQPQPGKETEEAFSAKLGEIPREFHYLHNDKAPQAIEDFIAATGSQLLITVSHHHSLLQKLLYGSVSKKVAYRARVPMLVLHDA